MIDPCDIVLSDSREITGVPADLDNQMPHLRLVSPFLFHKGGFVTKTDKTRLRGLCPVLQQCFYPTWSYDQVTAMYKAERKSLRERGLDGETPMMRVYADNTIPASASSKAAAHIARARSKNKSMAQGKMVDEQCNAMIMHTEIREHKHQIPVSPSDHTSNVHLMARWGMTMVNIPANGIHPLVWRFFHYMDNRGLVPLCAQTIVGDTKLGIATAVDQLWRYRGTGRLLLVEMKKWENGTYNKHTGNMCVPFDQKKNHAQNQHQLQLLLSLYLLQHTFHICIDEAWVVRLHTTGISIYPLCKWARDSRTLDTMLEIMAKFTRSLAMPCAKRRQRDDNEHNYTRHDKRDGAKVVRHERTQRHKHKSTAESFLKRRKITE